MKYINNLLILATLIIPIISNSSAPKDNNAEIARNNSSPSAKVRALDIMNKRTKEAPYKSMEQAIATIEKLNTTKLGVIGHDKMITKKIMGLNIETIIEKLTFKNLVATKFNNQKTYDLQYSPDGRTILSPNENETFTVSDVATGKINYISPGTYPQFSPDGNMISAIRNNKVTILDAVTGAERWILIDGKSAQFSHDSSKLLVAHGTKFSVFDNHSGALLYMLDAANHIQFSPDNSKISIAYEDRNDVADAQTGTMIYSLPRGFVEISPDGTKIMVLDQDKPASVYNTNSGKLRYTINLSGIGHFSPNSTKIAISPFASGGLSIFDAQNGKLLKEIAKEASVSKFYFTSDSTKIFANLRKNPQENAYVWDITSGQLLFKLYKAYYSVVFNHDNNIGAIMDFNLLRLFDSNTGIVFNSFKVDEAKGDFSSVYFNPVTADLVTNVAGNALLWKKSPEQIKRWNPSRLDIDQMILLWLIDTYYPKLKQSNPNKITEVLKLISYFQNIDYAYIRSIFQSFTSEQKQDLHEMYNISI
ncbi:MAG: hypothetical protein P4L31_01325 [Candidatus Babeliales bacterium]|nr:hypothetical protein [Candidatus Babeliales bacterium]